MKRISKSQQNKYRIRYQDVEQSEESNLNWLVIKKFVFDHHKYPHNDDETNVCSILQNFILSIWKIKI